eukprot:3766211-Rhodomonas_salina.1
MMIVIMINDPDEDLLSGCQPAVECRGKRKDSSPRDLPRDLAAHACTLHSIQLGMHAIATTLVGRHRRSTPKPQGSLSKAKRRCLALRPPVRTVASKRCDPSSARAGARRHLSLIHI